MNNLALRSIPSIDELVVTKIAVDDIRLSPLQVRRDYGEQELEQLATSLKEKGLIQPIVVRRLHGKRVPYEVVAGERRLRAARRAGLLYIPAVVHELKDRDALELAIAENLQREDLNPIEEALSYRKLTEQFDATQDEVAKLVGKSRTAVTNTLRLLQLPTGILKLIRDGQLSEGHGRVLLMATSPALRQVLAQRAVRHEWSVRTLEEAVATPNVGTAGRATPSGANGRYSHLEKRLRDGLGAKSVRVKQTPRGTMRVSLEFPDETAWRQFVERNVND